MPFKIVGFPDEYTVSEIENEIFIHYGSNGSGHAEAARRLLANL